MYFMNRKSLQSNSTGICLINLSLYYLIPPELDLIEKQAFKRKTRRRMIIFLVSLLVLVAFIVGVLVKNVASQIGFGRVPIGI